MCNDAGIGKGEAGIAALAMLQAHGMPGRTVAHTSTRIGEARDIWEHGVVSYRGGIVVPGMRLTVSL